MVTDWKNLAALIGEGSTSYAMQALEEILGDEWIANTVEHAISFKSGSELALNCLQHLCSIKASKHSYQIYKTSQGEKSVQAVWLIKHIAHPASAEWIDEFLNDEKVMEWGLGLLDQLLWRHELPFTPMVESLLSLADNRGLDTSPIREYLKKRQTD